MILVTPDVANYQVRIKIENISISDFQSIVATLKLNACKYKPADHEWVCSVFTFDRIRNALEASGAVKVDQPDALAFLRQGGQQELVVNRVKTKCDYSRLLYPPIQGKHPFENFQDDDITSGVNRNRYGFFLGPGAGKSYITSALISYYLFQTNKASRALLLTTSIGVRNLYHEILKFTKDLSEDQVYIADKDHREPFSSPDAENAKVVICSYNSFRLICENYKKIYKIKTKLPAKPFLPLNDWLFGRRGLLLLDESHEVMYQNSQRGYYVALHAEAFYYRYLFSGTPADDPSKLYNQFRILDPWLVYNLNHFEWQQKVANIGTFFSPYAVSSWKRDEISLMNQRFVNGYGIYRNTKDILDLPAYNEKTIYIPMEHHHRKLYEAFIHEDLSKGKKDVKSIVNRFPYLLLSVENPFLLKKHEEKFSDNLIKMINNFKEGYLAKIDAVEDILDDHPKEKGIVWVLHPDTAFILERRFKKHHPLVITGDTKDAERNAIVEEFKKGNHQILIANIMVLNTSLTITEATFQIYVERTFAYSPYSQSTQRIYRAGQTKDVSTYILLYDKSLDVLQDNNLKSKGLLVKGLVQKDFLSKEEWQSIFNCEERSHITVGSIYK